MTHGSAPTFRSAQRAEQRKEVTINLPPLHSLTNIKSTFLCSLIDYFFVGFVWFSITKSLRRKTKRLKLKGTSLNKGKR